MDFEQKFGITQHNNPIQSDNTNFDFNFGKIEIKNFNDESLELVNKIDSKLIFKSKP